MKKTFLELTEVDQMVGLLYRKDPNLKNSKFGYAYTQFYKKNYSKPLEEYKEELSMLQIDHALEDKTTKEVLINKESSRGFSYSKEGLKKIIQAEGKLSEEWENKEIEITPYISTYKPEGLTEEQVEALTGLVL